jgi:hypothetical protein
MPVYAAILSATVHDKKRDVMSGKRDIEAITRQVVEGAKPVTATNSVASCSTAPMPVAISTTIPI